VVQARGLWAKAAEHFGAGNFGQRELLRGPWRSLRRWDRRCAYVDRRVVPDEILVPAAIAELLGL
jgi:hypothetical protein